MLLVDASRMMTTYCGTRTKFDTVLEAAVLLTLAALDQGDAVGLVLFADRIDAYLGPRRDRRKTHGSWKPCTPSIRGWSRPTSSPS